MKTEKIMPCPFCGSECSVACFDGDEPFIVCSAGCGYHSAWRDDGDEAIAAHNRVAEQMVGIKANNWKGEKCCKDCVHRKEDDAFGHYCEMCGLFCAPYSHGCVAWKAKEDEQ